MAKSSTKGLLERLRDGETVLCAEGYIFEFERRGYLKAGSYVPEVVVEHPELVKQMYEEFVHAGSDVVLAFTYYGHREKLRHIKRENDLEYLNRQALRMAREVADATGTLMAGNLCNTTAYCPDDPSSPDTVRAMFKEQVEWAVDEGADYIVAESISHTGEALIALETIKEYGRGLPAVVTLFISTQPSTMDSVPLAEAVKRLEDAGAAAVGLNCARGPRTMIGLIPQIRDTVKIPIAVLPVCFRTDERSPVMTSLKDPATGERSFPHMDVWYCSQRDIASFTLEAKALGAQYFGLCCGNCSHYTRTMAEALGRTPPASRYSSDMNDHFRFGSNPSIIRQENKKGLENV